MTPSEIKSGMKFGHWEVVRYSHTNDHRVKYFLCKCDVCGTERAVRASALLSGTSTSCSRACSNDLTGLRINGWTIQEKDVTKPGYYWCECKCGARQRVFGPAVKYGMSLDCGCGGERSGSVEPLKLDTHDTREAHQEMALILKNRSIPFKEKSVFEECRSNRPLPFNFSLFSNRGTLLGVVDLGGAVHYSARGTFWGSPDRQLYIPKHDYIKQKFCEDNGIPLLIIPYQYFDELEKFLITSDFWTIITKNFND